MFFEPHFTPDPNAWPPTASTGGILGLAFPDYIRGIDLNNKEAWSVDEWRAYARYLEEYGKTIIDRLEQKLNDTEDELTIQLRMASRKKETKRFKEIMSQPQSAWEMRKMLKQLRTERVTQPVRFIEQREPGESPLMPGMLSFFHKPTKKRGPRKNEERETIKYARQILQIQSEYESQGQHKTYAAIWREDIIARLKVSERLKIKDRFKTIKNTIPQVKKSR